MTWQGEGEEEPYDPLAVLLLHACMHLCFLPNFSIDASATHIVRTLASESGATLYSPKANLL
jgi:hypothetical protein